MGTCVDNQLLLAGFASLHSLTYLSPSPPPAPRFVVGAEAVELFRKSGLDIDALKQIWLLADKDADGKLTPKEFCVAWHLIICITKKGLPLPRTLPLALVNFMAHAPDVPQALPSLSEMASADAPKGAHTNSVSKSPSPRLSASASSAAATSYSALRNSAPTVRLEDASSLSEADGTALQTATDFIKSAAEKAVAGSTTASDSVRKSALSIKELLRKLSAEKISLDAKVFEAVQDAAESNKRLEMITDEITELSDECARLHVELQQALDSKIDSQSKLIDAAGERQKLAQKIEDMRVQISQINAEKNSISTKISSTQVALAQNAERGAAYESDRTNLSSDISTSQGELAVLRTLLSNLSTEKTELDVDVSTMRMRLDAANAELDRIVLINHSSAADIAALKAEKAQLAQEKSSLFVDIATSANVNQPQRTSPVKAPKPESEGPALFRSAEQTVLSSKPAQAFVAPDPLHASPVALPEPPAAEAAAATAIRVPDATTAAETVDDTKLSARSKLERFRREKSMEKGSKSSLAYGAASQTSFGLKEPDDGKPESKVAFAREVSNSDDFGGFEGTSPVSASGFAADSFPAFEGGFDAPVGDSFGASFPNTVDKNDFAAGFDEGFGGSSMAAPASSDGFDASFGGGSTSTPFDSFGADSFAAFDAGGVPSTTSGTPFDSFGDSAFDDGTATKGKDASGFDAFSSSTGDDAFAKW